MDYPQYRKYKNDHSYFKITDSETFVEWKKSGKNWERFDFKAQILPDRNYIQDMLTDYDLYWDAISVNDYQEFLQKNELK